MSEYTSHVDTFAHDHLPSRDLWPEFLFELPEVQYPERINCARTLLDDALAEGCSNQIAVIGGAERWTYRELAERANRIAHVLTNDFGLVPGNRVLLRAPNNPMLVASWLAVVKAGGIAVTTMAMLRAIELEKIVNKARIDFAICDARLGQELAQAAQRTGRLRHCVAYGDGELEQLMSRHPASFESRDTARDDVALLGFTSGTTGDPKATVHFHRDVLAMTDIVGRNLLRTGRHDICIGSPPLGFTFGLGALLAFPLRFRAATVLVESPSPDRLLAEIQRTRATCLFTAPTAYRAMFGHLGNYDFSTLRQCVSAGEPLPRPTSDAWYERTGIRIIDGLGATEMIHIFISAAGTDIRPGATGKVLPGYRACVLDGNGRPVPPGIAGNLAVKGPTGCRYLDDSRQTDYVKNGWNMTGDTYVVDQEGYFWFQARADDMIVSAGYNIAAPEVEIALSQHPAVQECAVVAAPDSERGSIVKAFVVLRGGFTSSREMAQELQQFVKQAIAPYKYPRAIEFVPSLPKTQTGKVQRTVLREWARAAATL